MMTDSVAVDRLAKAGALTGVVLYFVCLVVYLLLLRGEGPWMLQPFMPGLSVSAWGMAIGLVWSVGYGAAIPALWGFFFNALGGDPSGVR